MLFGGKTVRANVVKDALRFADERGFHLVFGAMVGGCSKGVQYYDSDYDTRFLYLDKNVNHIFYPWEEKEQDLKHRIYFDDAVSPYEWIPLWEITSFFQFLKNPAFDGRRSFGLYNIVGWTLQSPYTWDPYGLSQKLMPLVNAIFRKEYYIPYHVEEIHRLWTTRKKELIAKDYIYAIYEALCILYAVQYNVFPPVYMKTLSAALLEEPLSRDVFAMIHSAQKQAEVFCQASGSTSMHETHTLGMLRREEKYDQIIQLALEKAAGIPASGLSEQTLDRQIHRIYLIIEEAVYHEQCVQRAED